MYELTSTNTTSSFWDLDRTVPTKQIITTPASKPVPQRDCQVVQTFLQGRGGREHHVHLPFLKEYHKLTISQWQEALVWKGPVIIQSNNINLEWVSNQSDVHGSHLRVFPLQTLNYVRHSCAHRSMWTNHRYLAWMDEGENYAKIISSCCPEHVIEALLKSDSKLSFTNNLLLECYL